MTAGSGIDGTALPHRPPAPVVHGHRDVAPPVLLHSFRHEGLVVRNHQCFRGLGHLAGRWELALPDGRTLTAPAALPDLRPGETAAVPLPFELPGDGGEVWVTLRVTTKDDEPCGPRGTEVCAPRLRLRAASIKPAPADADRAVEPAPPVGGPPVEAGPGGRPVRPLPGVIPSLPRDRPAAARLVPPPPRSTRRVSSGGPIVHEPGNGDPWADTWFHSNPVFVDVKGD